MSHIRQVSEEKNVALAALCDSLEISRATLYRTKKVIRKMLRITQKNHITHSIAFKNKKYWIYYIVSALPMLHPTTRFIRY